MHSAPIIIRLVKHREDLGLFLKNAKARLFNATFFWRAKKGNFILGGSNFEHKNHEELHQRGEKTFLFFYIHSQETFYNIMIFLQLRILETQKSFVLVMTFVLFVS